MATTYSLTKSDKAVLIALCEDRLCAGIDKGVLTPEEQEQHQQVFDVYNKLVIGLEYTEDGQWAVNGSTDQERLMRKLALDTLNKLSTIDFIGSTSVYMDETSIQFSIFSPISDDEKSFPFVYELSFDIEGDHIIVEAMEEEVDCKEFSSFLNNQLEHELEEEFNE